MAGQPSEQEAANELTDWAWKRAVSEGQAPEPEQILSRFEKRGFSALSRMNAEQRASSSIERIAIAAALDDIGETGSISGATGQQLRFLGEAGNLQSTPGLSENMIGEMTQSDLDARLILQWSWLNANKGMNAATPEEFLSRFEGSRTPQSPSIRNALEEIRDKGKLSGESGYRLRVFGGM